MIVIMETVIIATSDAPMADDSQQNNLLVTSVINKTDGDLFHIGSFRASLDEILIKMQRIQGRKVHLDQCKHFGQNICETLVKHKTFCQKIVEWAWYNWTEHARSWIDAGSIKMIRPTSLAQFDFIVNFYWPYIATYFVTCIHLFRHTCVMT